MRLILPISFVVIIIALFLAVINPLYKDVKQIKADVLAYNVALDNSADLQKTRDDLVDKYKNIKIEDKERLNHFLPSTINNIELILEVERIANLHGFPIKDIRFETKGLEKTNETEKGGKIVAESDPADRLPYGIFPMEFIVEGKYNAFVDFLKDLELNLRLIDIKSISFSVSSPGAGVDTNSDVYSYTLRAEIYWLK